jgi:LPS export ABC transporter protein LptC
MIKFFMKRSLLFVLSLFLLFSFFFLLKDEKGMRPDILLKGNSFIEGLRIIYKKNGNRDWLLTAKRADISENGDRAYLTDIEMTIENKGITLYADKGTYLMTDKNLTIEGRITAKGDTYSITSVDGEFDNRAGNFKTNGDVRIDSKKFSVQGRGMNIDSSEQKVRILNNVKAFFYN